MPSLPAAFFLLFLLSAVGRTGINPVPTEDVCNTLAINGLSKWLQHSANVGVGFIPTLVAARHLLFPDFVTFLLRPNTFLDNQALARIFRWYRVTYWRSQERFPFWDFFIVKMVWVQCYSNHISSRWVRFPCLSVRHSTSCFYLWGWITVHVMVFVSSFWSILCHIWW